MINVKNLDKYYFKGKSNQIHVISNTSLELPDRGLISFLGNSGSGKTTLLSVIGGLDKANGSIEYDDFKMNKYDMNKMDEYRSLHIGYVFQNFNLLLDETVYNNLKIALEIIGITDEEEIEKRIEFTLKAVGMFKFRKKKAFALSGGQQQRVAIARALLKKSKIIIADEPTGNLDSQNSIEIMNILKKISKTTLILLVTHDKHIADFYSDHIYEIKDGEVVNSYVPSNIGGLDKVTDNTIYLKDLKESNEEMSIGKLCIYSDTEEQVKLNLSIIIKNGTIYLNTDKPIKLVNEAKVSIINDHYKKLSAEEVDEFNYDTTWYNDEAKSSKNIFKRCLDAFTSALYRNINVSRKMKAFHFGLVLLGIMLSATVILFNNYNEVDTSKIDYNLNYNTIINDDPKYNTKEILTEAYENNVINGLMTTTEVYYRYTSQITFNCDINDMGDSNLLYCDNNQVQLYFGTYPNNDNKELLVTKAMADNWIEESFGYLNYDKIVGSKITLESDYLVDDFTIVGITIEDQGFLYTDQDTFLKYTFHKNTFYKGVKLRYHENEVDSNGNKIYKVVGGRDVNPEAYNEILVSAEKRPDLKGLQIGLYEDLGKTTIGGYEYRIVGVFEYPYEISGETYISTKIFYNTSGFKFASMPSSEYNIIEGRDIENKNEVIMPHNRNCKIGDKVSGKTVVGIYTGSTLAMSYSGLVNYNECVIESDSSDAIFIVNNQEEFEFLLSKYECQSYNLLESAKYLNKKYDNANSIFSIAYVVLFVVGIIFIYSTMRSKMIKDIYKIGVYRSLGSLKSRIYKRYFVDVFVLSLITTGIGYTITTIVYYLLHSTINIYISSIQLLFNIEYFIIFGVFIVIIMIIFGLLPIYLLLKKTPSEICAKYDI